MTCKAATPVGTVNTCSVGTAGMILCAAMLAGCSASPAIGPGSPSYLGARDLAPPATTQSDASPRVSPSKVLSAVVFERVTGLEVDPARLIER